MKIAHYEQMMDYLTGPRESFRNGGRIGFSKGGAAKVYDYLESLPEGTEIDLNFVRDYVEKNNIDADANNVFKNFYEIDRKQKAASGNITFKHGEERRKQLQRIKNKLVFKKLKEFIPATKENLEKLDNLIKNTDLNVEQIGKELGFRNPKSLKFTPTSKNVLVKEYIEKYGNPSEGRFKRRLTPDSEIVKKAIELKETPLSTRQIARELGVSQSAVVNYFRAGNREDLIGEVPVKKEGTPVDRKKKARMENIAEGEKFASKSDKAFNKAEDLRVQKINTFLKNNSDQLVNNQKFINLVNLKLDGKGNIISKNKSPDEIAELLKKDRLFERDHISSVAKRKRNMQFPVNFQMAPQNINQGFFGAAEAYINRPDADPEKIKKLSNVLDQYGLRLSTNKGTIGAKQIPASEVIDRNLKALGLSTEIGKPSGAVPMSLGVTGDIEMAKNILQKDAATAKNLFSKGFTGFDKFLLRPLTAIEAPTAALPQSAFQAGKLIGDVKRGEQTDVKGMDITLPTSLSSLAASKKFGLDLFADNAGRVKRFLRGPFTQQGIRTLSRGSVFATPVIETAIQGYNARQRLLKAREQYGTDDMVPTGLGMAPREYVRDLAIENQKFEGEGLSPFQAAGGGIAKLAGKSSGPPPESGPLPQGLDFLIKRGRQS